MKVRLIGLLTLCCALFVIISLPNQTSSQTSKSSNTNSLSAAEQELLKEINLARAQPRVYATYLEGMKPLFNGKEFKPSKSNSFTTQEGWAAVEDAIKFLRAAKPLGPLSASSGLCLAALKHVKDQSNSGATGHRGADSTFIEQRVKPFGAWQGGLGENLSYGAESPRDRLLTWIIDDGFASRGHRMRLLSNDYKVAGISCGPHPEYNTMCVVTLAGGFTDAASPTTASTTEPAKPVVPTTKSKPKARRL